MNAAPTSLATAQAVPPAPLHIAHVITGLGRGGAEIQLLRVLRRLAGDGYRFTVFSLTSADHLRAEFEACGVEVRMVGMGRGRPSFASLRQLSRELRAAGPDLVQTWLYQSDVAGSLAARVIGRPVVWTLQSGPLSDGQLSLTARLARRLLKYQSGRWPARIICSSQHTQRFHQKFGFDAGPMTFVPNGADTVEFAPDAARRRATRAALGIVDDAVLVGMCARFDPQKDYHNFIQAAGLVHRQRPDVHFLACGSDITPDNPRLAEWIAAAEVGEVTHLIGLRDDIAAIDGALDVGCLSSAFGETFPLAISETMACGVPCAVTDVGDLAYMVGETGTVAPPGDAAALAAGLLELIELPAADRVARGLAARRRVEELFSIDATAAGYAAVWHEALAGGR